MKFLPYITPTKVFWLLQFCNETDITKNTNRIQHSTNINTNMNSRVESKPRFNLIYNIEYGDNDDDMTEEVNVHIDWGGQSKTTLMNLPRELLKKVSCWLFIGSPEIGGKVLPNSIIYGYTEIKHNGIIYIAHSCYKKKVVGMIGLTLSGMYMNSLYLLK